jgi:hypothetical protein
LMIIAQRDRVDQQQLKIDPRSVDKGHIQDLFDFLANRS